MMEPGRFIVGNSTDLVLKVLNTKRTDVANWIILDGGTNLLPVLTLFSEFHKIEVCIDDPKLTKTSVGGPLLYSADVIAANRPLPKASVGDLVIMRDVGAYCVSQSNQFLYPRAATVFVDKDKVSVAQRRETVDDVLSRELR
jgi:diaminopimelate decarboxylase